MKRSAALPLFIGLALIVAAVALYGWSARRAEAARLAEEARLDAARQAAAAQSKRALGKFSEQDLARMSEGGGIQVSAVFLNPIEPSERQLAFEVFFTTHGGSVAGYKLEGLSTLANDQGAKVADGFTWTSESDDGHHRYGILRVGRADASGRPLITAETKRLTLEIQGIGDVTRTFTWEPPYLAAAAAGGK
ncbi:MAG TPA: hypothetical protein VGL40_03080 [Bacillota bacterium]